MAQLRQLTKVFFKKFQGHPAFKEALLFQDWQTVIGEDSAKTFRPLKITRHETQRQLHLETTSSGMLSGRYMEPMLLDRINRFFGEQYVHTLRLHQRAKTSCTTQKKPAAESMPEAKTLDEALNNIKEKLRF